MPPPPSPFHCLVPLRHPNKSVPAAWLGLALNDLGWGNLDWDHSDNQSSIDADWAPIDANQVHGDAGPALNEPKPAVDDVDLAGVDMEYAMGMEEAGPEPQGSDVDMNVDDDGDSLPAPPPEVPPAPCLCRNPPVMIEEWPDPNVSDVDSNPDDIPMNDAERDPEYVEQDEPLGFDPDDKPATNDKEVWAFLEEHLGDLAYDKWIDILL
ncbi:hypothetical protein FRC06_001598 [Ceratobasidium sp. 370]|nr:hypothetical protein FRC06_001598 [Ceratobasidium sp. 370]